jgi:hypothetical protein
MKNPLEGQLGMILTQTAAALATGIEGALQLPAGLIHNATVPAVSEFARALFKEPKQ